MNHLLKRYTKQIVIILLLLLATIVLATFITSKQLTNSLRDLYVQKLSALKTSLKVSIENYFTQKSSLITTLSHSDNIKDALKEFTLTFRDIPFEYKKPIQRRDHLNIINNHLQRTFYNVKHSALKKSAKAYIPNNKSGEILQNLYIAKNPFDSHNKYRLFNSNEKLSYDLSHKKYHQLFLDLLKRHHFYDIFLIDTKGNIIYTVFKELDLGSNLHHGIYKNSSLAHAYKAALSSKKISFHDFQAYEPSYNKPAAFFAIPVGKMGVIAFQISIEDIDNIMTFHEKWEEIGLGKSGESYLVGPDYLMRSNSRFTASINNEIINELATTVGILNVKSFAIEEALKGKTDQGLVTDYRKKKVLSSYTPVKVFNTIWALAVEIDLDEINSEIENMVKSIFTTGIILVLLSIALLAYVFLRLVLKPIENFEKELDNKVKEKTNDLKLSTAILNDYKTAVDEGSIVSKTNTKGIITYVNDKFCEISGFSRDELLGKPHNVVRHPDNPKSIFEEIWRTILNKRIWKGIIKNRKKDAGDYIVQSTIAPILDDNNNIIEFISIRTDITELMKKEKKILEQTTDDITKLPNKIKLLEDIKYINSDITLALIQINKFKEINDYYGYKNGDSLLISFTSILKSITSDSSIQIYKIVSGEFALFCNSDLSMERFIEIIENIIKYYDHNIVAIDSNSFNISLSAGIAKGEKAKLFFNAEMALRKAIESSQTLITFEDSQAIEKEYESNILMTKKIKEAIKNDNILLFAQPILSNYPNIPLKYECLIRMRDGDKILSPFFFLEIAKRARLYPTLTKIVIEKSFDFFKDRKEEFSINLNIEDILSESIVLFLKKKINHYKIGHRLVIELVESEGIENFDDVLSFIKELKAYGCKFAIDDFGTGYSNFEYLMKLDVDYIKIDGSLIKNIDSDKSSQIVAELIVDFSKKMNIKTIAEFIHNDAVYKKIKSLNIDYSQGYHLGEPKPLDEI